MDIKTALNELRKEKKRKFSQSLDVIINLKGIDLRRENINTVILMPHKSKEKRVCGFLNDKSNAITTITKLEFAKYKDKNALKNLVKRFDFFIASAPLMPSVATTFGKVLGPAGKMPSPQLGILAQESDESIKQVLDKISKSVKVRIKEPSIKVNIGKDEMKDEELIENFNKLYEGIIKVLPKNKENVKNIMLKFTMTKPFKVEVSNG